jgi:hypothetical protein
MEMESDDWLMIVVRDKGTRYLTLVDIPVGAYKEELGFLISAAYMKYICPRACVFGWHTWMKAQSHQMPRFETSK